MILLSINTGLRRGELFSLEKKDINLNQKLITIESTNAKNNRTRHIPLNKEAYQILSDWIEMNSNETDLIFPNKDGKRFNNVKSS